MRIYVFVHGWLPALAAGSERALQHVLQPLVDRGDDITLWALQSLGDDYIHEGITVKQGTPKISALDKPDLIMTHHRLGCVFGAMVADYFGAPLVNYLHNERYDIDEMFLCRPDYILYNTQWVKDKLQYDIPGMVVHPPLEAERHKTAPGSKVTLINMSDNKGVDTFYGVAKLLKEIDFLGVQGTHGAQRLDVYSNVDIMLTTQDMRDVWSQTGLLLMPSGYESYGMCAAEAAVSGIPTIAHPTPGLKECLGSSGVFVDRNDYEGYAKVITRFFEDTTYQKSLKRKATVCGKALVKQSKQELQAWVSAIPNIVAAGRPVARDHIVALTNHTGAKITCGLDLASSMLMWGWRRDELMEAY